MPKIRVLVVDDSVVMRRILAKNLAADAEIEVAGFASNGRLALEKIPHVNPDAVTLNIEMPEMDGLQTLREIRKTYPKLPVIIVSAINPRDAGTTLDALALGASDYVVKPMNGNRESAEKILRDELIPKIKALCVGRETLKPPVPTRGPPAAHERIEIVAIGISTGGPNALTEVLSQLPTNFPVPILIVQHMPPLFTKLLAERLSTKCRFPVREAASEEVLAPGRAWLAPGDRHMELTHVTEEIRIILHQEPPQNACRPSVDVLLRSVTEIYGAGVLAVIMTGMGQDGLRGCRQVREAGGQIIVQDEATSVVWGMPGAVAREGLEDKILPLQAIAGEIMERVQRGRTTLSL